jgi:two-component system sensor histidine kinase/response regulator
MQTNLDKKRQFTILLVDDREENLISLEDILEADNRVFLKARSGNDALKTTLKNDNIGLIMLDVQMPGMDGFEVAELLKSNARTKDISIIFVTAINKEEQYVMKGYGHGAVDYLQKPLDINVTKAKVNVFEQLYFHQEDLKNTIEQKNKINKQLERFMYIVAHDLKSPLNGVVGLLDIMQKDSRIVAAEELSYYMKLMLDASRHLTGMISSILDYSRKSDFEQSEEDVDVHELVSQIAHLLFPPKNILIRIEGNLPGLRTKKFKLHQVFQNLISNAIKYNDKEHGEIVVGHEDDGEFYKFYIKDNGPGIKEKDNERIFKLFETTDNKSNADSSTGVGLNIIKMLVEEQGGKITVHSVPHVETCFYFQWAKR